MKRPAPLLLLPLFLPCCTTPQTETVQPIPLVVPDFVNMEEAPPSELELALEALPHAERMALAAAIIDTNNWGRTHEQQVQLRTRFMSNTQTNFEWEKRNILRKVKLPQGCSAATRALLERTLKEEQADWGLICEFIPLVAKDYLTEHPQDTRAWDFLNFMVTMSDGEMTYHNSVIHSVREAGLEQHTEGQRLLHHDEHFSACGQADCPYCATLH